MDWLLTTRVLQFGHQHLVNAQYLEKMPSTCWKRLFVLLHFRNLSPINEEYEDLYKQALQFQVGKTNNNNIDVKIE